MRTLPTFAVAAMAAFAVAPSIPAQAAEARGTVYLDRDRDGRRDVGDPGVRDIRVTNGREVVRTDDEGRWSIAVDDDDIVFVIKPRGFMVATDVDHVPRGYYVHKPNGSPKLRFGGVPPTGRLPEGIDFPLVPNEEPDRFRMVVFGDPQPRDLKEVDWIGHDVLDRIDIRNAVVGIALGDIAFNDLKTFEPLNATIGKLGLPFFYVYGNHDMNFDASRDDLADETWERVYGPTNYAFDWGPVHFVVLDDVLWHPATVDGKGRRARGRYTGHFDEEALGFLRADLAEAPRDQLVVVAFHIHLGGVDNKAEFFAALGDRPHTLSLSAHTHVHRVVFYGADQGYRGPGEHVHINHGTLCGSWFRGQPDVNGIPHATMADGGPNGWGILTFDGSTFSHRYYGAGMPAHEQMRIVAPPAVTASERAEVVVNVFAGSSRNRVEMRFADTGDWIPMERVERPDPAYRAAFRAEAALGRVPWRKLPKPAKCRHLWAAKLPAGPPLGTHRIEVRTVDMFEQEFRAERTIRVVPDPAGAGASDGN